MQTIDQSPPMLDPRGRPLVVLGERIGTAEDAERRYVELRARVRRDEQCGGARPCDRQAVQQLGEALAHRRGCSAYDVQVSARAAVAAAYQRLLASA
jgi:hypothetical protein